MLALTAAMVGYNSQLKVGDKSANFVASGHPQELQINGRLNSDTNSWQYAARMWLSTMS
jgi:hypothetical protein